MSNVSVPLVYLSNEVLHDPCTAGGCGQPIDDLSPGGVLVLWSANGSHVWTLAKAPGQPMTVGGQQAKIVERHPEPCRALGADVSITVEVDRGPFNYYRVWACLRAPGTALAESWFKRILASTTIKGT